MARKTDHKIINIGPIQISREFWIQYGYALLPVERACKEILAARDVGAHNQFVQALATMLGGLHLDLQGAARPVEGTEQ